MGTLGSYLREARESMGLDLRDAAQQTRITLLYLKAIEDEDFARLPGEVFVKGFLKNYARFLGLPEDEVMRRYAEVKAAGPGAVPPPSGRTETPQTQRPAQETPPAAATGAKLERYVWGGAAVIAVIAFLLVVVPSRRAPVKQPAPVATMPATTTAPTTTPTPGRSETKLFLDIVALEDVWLLVRTDSSPQKKAVLRKGETVSWIADERFVLSYGAIGALKLVLNGKELAVAGAKNTVVRDLIVTAAGIASQKSEPEMQVKPKPRLRTAPAPTVPVTLPSPTVPATPQAPVPVPQEPAPPAPPAPAPEAPVPAPKPKPGPADQPPAMSPQEG